MSPTSFNTYLSTLGASCW